MKNVLIFLAGVAAGAAASYFVTKKKCSAEADAILDDIQQTYNERLEKINKQHAQIEEMSRKKDEMMKEIEKQDAEAKTEDDPHNSTEYTDYSAIYKPAKKEDDSKSPIRVITEAEEENYVNDKGYDMRGLSVYKDGVVIDDENEEVVKDYESLLGNGCVDMIFSEYHDGETLCILTEDKNTVFDITVSEERFGGDDEPGEIE